MVLALPLSQSLPEQSGDRQCKVLPPALSTNVLYLPILDTFPHMLLRGRTYHIDILSVLSCFVTDFSCFQSFLHPFLPPTQCHSGLSEGSLQVLESN